MRFFIQSNSKPLINNKPIYVKEYFYKRSLNERFCGKAAGKAHHSNLS